MTLVLGFRPIFFFNILPDSVLVLFLFIWGVFNSLSWLLSMSDSPSSSMFANTGSEHYVEM